MKPVELLIGALLLVGCAAPESADDRAAAIRSAEIPTRIPVVPAEAALGAEPGLLLWRLRVPDEASAFAHSMTGFGQVDPVEEPLSDRLRASGLRLRRLALTDLPSFMESLGRPEQSVDSWLGQPTRWTKVVDRPIGRGAAGVALDGGVQRIEGGNLRLMVRGFNLLMEDGPRFHLELLPEHDRNPRKSAGAARLRGDPLAGGFEGSRFAHLLIEVLMEPGYAYVLVGERPATAWNDPQGEMQDGEENAGTGPEAEPPVSFGEALLTAQSLPSWRDVIIFVPRFAPSPDFREDGADG